MFSNRLKEARENSGLSQVQLAEKIGVSKDLYNKYERTKTHPSFETVIKIAGVLNVSVDYLLGAKGKKDHKLSVPVIGKIQAGRPSFAAEDISGYEEIDADMAARGEYFALIVKGQSMEPKFSNGDVVIVRRQEDVESGEIAAVLVGQENATVKKITKHDRGISLNPTNPDFDPIFYSSEEINRLPVKILGKIVELRSRF